MKEKNVSLEKVERILEKSGLSTEKCMVIGSGHSRFSELIKLRKKDLDGVFILPVNWEGQNIIIELGKIEKKLREGGIYSAFVAESYSAEIEKSVFYIFIPVREDLL